MRAEKRREFDPTWEKTKLLGLAAATGFSGLLLGTHVGGVVEKGAELRQRESQVREVERVLGSYAESAKDLQDIARSSGNATVRSGVERSVAYHLGALEAHRSYALRNPSLVRKIDRVIQGFRSVARSSR